MSTHDHTSSCCHKPQQESSCCPSTQEKHAHHHAVAADSCHAEASHHDHGAGDSCCPPKEKTDWLLWGSAILVAIGFVLALLPFELPGFLNTYAEGVYELASRMWWGVLIGLVMVGFLSKVPREFVLSVMGKGGTFTGLVRAVLAGVLLDLCNHGILMVGAKLYERGASYGQVVAFLVASPWNSFSLTLVLVALIGLKWTIAFIVFSMVIALVAGVVFDVLERKGIIAANPNKADLPEDFHFWTEAKAGLKAVRWDGAFFADVAKKGVSESRMVLRWILFGIVLAVVVRAFMTGDMFSDYFGPTLLGLLATIGAATIIEVCSEGSTPLAADLITRANAPGNSFAFLMTGVATDYTEIMVLKSATGRWLNALLLPVVTVPQVLVVAYFLNMGV
ncbi:permease [Kordiimonas gwangyangensis]|uniref:permease n=1 Tax=Kordiimonas gwangyangensis TaxID=288022 RepID=UPI00036AF114|nr:permease [Kordiimonas gwangyangensis]